MNMIKTNVSFSLYIYVFKKGEKVKIYLKVIIKVLNLKLKFPVFYF